MTTISTVIDLPAYAFDEIETRLYGHLPSSEYDEYGTADIRLGGITFRRRVMPYEKPAMDRTTVAIIVIVCVIWAAVAWYGWGAVAEQIARC